jgi:hypothetical protein
MYCPSDNAKGLSEPANNGKYGSSKTRQARQRRPRPPGWSRSGCYFSTRKGGARCRTETIGCFRPVSGRRYAGYCIRTSENLLKATFAERSFLRTRVNKLSKIGFRLS